MIGKTFDHYRIVEELGGGSMGVVYRALDTRLERTVALKFLPPGSTREATSKQRFLREARAASRLDHPNICTIHEIRETDDGGLYIVMASYEGETLQERIERGSLPAAEAVAISAQIASGLMLAHERGIVHRDIKPANIQLVREGQAVSGSSGRARVKILDFGLARVADDATLTRAGSAPGTPQYMAPEQIRGEIDSRSDLWSLGIVLYEMLTGARPFQGSNASVVIYSILHRTPTPIEVTRPGLPGGLVRLIDRLLTKDPEERIASAAEVEAELAVVAASLPPASAFAAADGWHDTTRVLLPEARGGRSVSTPRARIPTGPVAVLAVILATALGVLWMEQREDIAEAIPTGFVRRGLPAIAVLPFDDLSPQSGQTFFADGLTEVLITDLAKVSGLRVISRASAIRYKGISKPMPEIARELRVHYLLEGSVLRLEDAVRISAQLVDGELDQVLWSESYERPLAGVLALQSDVARAVVDQIEVRLTPRETRALTETAAVDPQALDAFIRARALWNERTVASIEQGIELLEQAIAIDPSYALAHVALAESYQILGEVPFHAMPTREADRLAQIHARWALELDPSQGEAYATLAMVDAHRWDWRGAEEKFRRAIDLSPGYATAHQWYGETLLLEKRWDEARRAFWRAEVLDPLSPIIHGQIGRLLIYSGHYQEAARVFSQQTRQHPEFWLNYYGLAAALIELGEHSSALQAIDRAYELSGGSEFAALMTASTQAQAGDPTGARELLARMSEKGSAAIPPALIASLAISIGDHERTLRELERGVTLGDPTLPFINIDPVYDPLRQVPRFREILRTIGLD